MTEVQTAAETSPRAASNRPSIYKIKPCLECGCEFRPGREGEAFCAPVCRKGWNNRRQVRGAQLYDMMMALRYERDEAKALKVWTAMTRMAQGFKEEDDKARGGRRSWRRIRDVLADNVWLQTISTFIRAGR